MKNSILTLLTGVAVSAIVSCSKADETIQPPAKVAPPPPPAAAATVQPPSIEFKDQSVTPPLLKKLQGFESLGVYSLLSSEDKLSESPTYVFGGTADGAGVLKAADGKGYVMMVNNEDNFSVSRIFLNENFKPVKGEYYLNSNGGQWRLCSATLATPAEHGFGPLYLTCGESGESSMIHALDPLVVTADPSNKTLVKGALGHWAAENAVPLPKTAYPGKTVIVIGEDDSEATGGQLALYLAATGDLENGELYMLKRKEDNQRERDMVTSQLYDVQFEKIQSSGERLTGTQIQSKTDVVKAIKFGRVEDIDYRKGGGSNGREIYFNVTGQNDSGVNSDFSRTRAGRVYRLTLNENDPLSGKLEVILDGDDANGPAKMFQNPDNICVTENFAYIQEDANGYGTETHDAYIYQYDIKGKTLRLVFELDQRRDGSEMANKFKSQDSKKGSWEYGALTDISEVVGVPDVFTLNVQLHSWTDAKFRNPDGGAAASKMEQGSQVLLIKGLPR